MRKGSFFWSHGWVRIGRTKTYVSESPYEIKQLIQNSQDGFVELRKARLFESMFRVRVEEIKGYGETW